MQSSPLRTLAEFSKEQTQFSYKALEWLVSRNARDVTVYRKTGPRVLPRLSEFDGAFPKVGGRRFVHVEKFYEAIARSGLPVPDAAPSASPPTSRPRAGGRRVQPTAAA